MPKKFNLVVRLQNWMDSVPGQTFLNYAYSWGASIVILGALFKLTHLPGGNTMLFLGMGTEVIVFFISAFDRPFDKTADGKEIPMEYVPMEEKKDDETIAFNNAVQTETATEGSLDDAAQQENADATDSPAVTPAHVGGGVNMGGPVIVGGGVSSIGLGEESETPAGTGAVQGGTIVIGGGAQVAAAVSGQPAEGAAVLEESAAAGIMIPKDANAEQLTTIIREANNELLQRAQAVLSPEMEAVTRTYIDRLRALTDTLSKVDEQSARLAHDNDELERLSRTLTSINSIYELQLKGASTQIVTIDQINAQTKQLVTQIEELNGVYSRMIQALTVNARATGAVQPE